MLQDPRRESRPAVESQDLLVLFVLRSLSRSLSIRVAGRGLRRAAAEKQRQDGHQTKYVCEICDANLWNVWSWVCHMCWDKSSSRASRASPSSQRRPTLRVEGTPKAPKAVLETIWLYDMLISILYIYTVYVCFMAFLCFTHCMTFLAASFDCCNYSWFQLVFLGSKLLPRENHLRNQWKGAAESEDELFRYFIDLCCRCHMTWHRAKFRSTRCTCGKGEVMKNLVQSQRLYARCFVRSWEFSKTWTRIWIKPVKTRSWQRQGAR